MSEAIDEGDAVATLEVTAVAENGKRVELAPPLKIEISGDMRDLLYYAIKARYDAGL